MNFLEYWQVILGVSAIIVWAVRVEAKVHYIGKATETHYETNRNRLDKMDGNHNGLSKVATEIVTTLAEIKNDLKWLKDSIKTDSFKK